MRQYDLIVRKIVVKLANVSVKAMEKVLTFWHLGTSPLLFSTKFVIPVNNKIFMSEKVMAGDSQKITLSNVE